jgi:hypothetical protein
LDDIIQWTSGPCKRRDKRTPGSPDRPIASAEQVRLAPGRNGERDFRYETRSNQTHASTTDPDARVYRKANGSESRLCFMGHVLMEIPPS